MSIATVRAQVRAEYAAWLAFAACLIAVFMQMIDVTIVNTALPELTADLGASRSAQLLVVSGYSLAFACTLLTAARIGAMVGRRTMFLASVAAFTAASLWCGIAGDATELVLARVVQGAAGAGMAAQTIAILTAGFPRERHPLVFALYGGVAGFAGMLGPIVGGVLLTLDLGGWGWRSVFLINLPIGMFAFALAWRFLHVGRSGGSRKLDLGGAVLSAAGLFALIYALAEIQQHGWRFGLIVLIGAGLALTAVFVVHQRRRTDPLIRLDLFTDRRFRLGSVLVGAFFGLFTAFVFAASVTMQDVLGYTPLVTGLVMTLFALGAGTGALASLILVRRWGIRALAAGMALYGGCLAAGAVYLSLTSGAMSALLTAGPVFLSGVGVGVFGIQLQPIMLSGLTPDHMAEASGVLPTVEQIGNAVGLTVLTTLFFRSHTLTGSITMMAAVAAIALVIALATLSLPEPQGP
ncbi:MFS transporter [Nocardia neocaledoniensis NBRC 108232]|uniref:EmrB/QacA subfamily drug resistance transporter n=1 Tax=Nocardia neocaledoniensis TaxID=236511 RepID=A0A317N5D5_9NOCA|nr:MFS transporter [Nocardia neocaledoniensis]PWV69877.1 EmrB/QacA subfamily drug resistance transporter [Nocardia neocaledoniensis]GEM31396.1 MFS transporter [Nocardia neocaledoniensis NBRC 108232]